MAIWQSKAAQHWDYSTGRYTPHPLAVAA